MEKFRSGFGEEYRHFDNLIWQGPSWCTAIFLGVLVASNQIAKDYATAWSVSDKIVLGLVLLVGFFFLLTCSYAVFRFRDHQTKVAPEGSYPKLGAQTLLQLNVTAQSAILLGLILHLVSRSIWIALGGFILVLVVCMAYYEGEISKRRVAKKQ